MVVFGLTCSGCSFLLSSHNDRFGRYMQKRFRLFLTGALTAVITGCATYQPDPLDAHRELDQLHRRDLQHFVVERAKSDHNSALTHAPFDPTDGLDEAEVVAVGLILNPELRARRAEIGESRAALITAGLWPNPEIGFGVRPGIDGASGYALEADALFNLLRPGERDAQKSVAQAHVDEAQAQVVGDEFKLVGEVRTQRLAVFAAERTVALLQEAVGLRQHALDLVKRQRELGEATVLDLSATELELAEARRDLRHAQAEVSVELAELNRLMGLPPSYDLKLTGLGEPLAITVFDDVADEELDARILSNRLELRAKEASYRRAEQELRLAVLQQYPRLGLGPAFERELEGSKSLGVGLSLELPLFNQNQGEIAEKRAARERSRAEYSALLHSLRADAFAARTAVRTAKAEVEAQEKTVLPLLKRNEELFEGAYRTREITIIDWITAQHRAVNARREFLDTLVGYREAIIQLEAAAGQSTATTAPSTQPN